MASRFFIQFNSPGPRSKLRVRVHDEDQSEFTSWCDLPSALKSANREVQLAAACEKSAEILSELEEAAKIAYIVFIHDQNMEDVYFNVHTFLEHRQALLNAHRLEQGLTPAPDKPKIPRL